MSVDKPNDATSPEVVFQDAIKARDKGDMRFAAEALDRLLAMVPNAPAALNLRARVALERCEPDALARFDNALRYDPGNPDLHLGKAQALEIAGDLRGARIVTQQIAQQAPGFIAALEYLASLYAAAGEANFCAPFEAAAQKAPQDPNIVAAHVNALAGLDRFAEAADIAARAQTRFPDEPHFMLLEAMHASSAGEWNKADKIFSLLEVQSSERQIAEARHRIRAQDIAAADHLLDQALQSAPHDVAAWALKGLVWRLGDSSQDKERAWWLHEQAGLVQMLKLQASKELLDDVRTLLVSLHEASRMPIGQSVRGGSQTKGVLFHRTEPALGHLEAAILATLGEYREALPASDAAHPLLSNTESEWALAGSWSVRLSGSGDHHKAHIHPAGLISSALYLEVPESCSASPDKAGWLEIGRPPPDLGLDLPPLRMIEPREGYLALFPSTLYHGTRSFDETATDAKEAGSCRMTVAFDVTNSAH